MQTKARPLTGQYNQRGGWDRGGGKGAEGRIGGGGGKGTGKAAGEGGEKGEHWKGQRTELTKRNSLTEDTPRDAVTNTLRLHLHNFAYKTFKIKNWFACYMAPVFF